MKKVGGTTPKVLDKMLSHELNTRKDEVKNFESLVRTEKVKVQIIELPRLPLDRIDNLTPQLRLARLRQVKTATNRRTQLKPGLSLESSTALKTKTDLLSSTDVQKNNDLLTVTELMMPIALRARPDQLSEEEKTKEIVLFELKKLPDRPEEKDEDEPQRLDQDTQANEARKEIIIKAIEWSKIKAKQKDEAITGKDVNLPKKPSGDTLSELARDLGLEHDGSWSALV